MQKASIVKAKSHTINHTQPWDQRCQVFACLGADFVDGCQVFVSSWYLCSCLLATWNPELSVDLQKLTRSERWVADCVFWRWCGAFGMKTCWLFVYSCAWYPSVLGILALPLASVHNYCMTNPPCAQLCLQALHRPESQELWLGNTNLTNYCLFLEALFTMSIIFVIRMMGCIMQE